MIRSQKVIKSDKATFLISIQVSSPQLGTSQSQKFLLKTQDEKTNEILENVTITGEVLYPSGGLARFEEDVRDKKGQLSYSSDVPENSEKGTYEARFSGAIEGYRNCKCNAKSLLKLISVTTTVACPLHLPYAPHRGA
jgi:hypothetical protein